MFVLNKFVIMLHLLIFYIHVKLCSSIFKTQDHRLFFKQNKQIPILITVAGCMSQISSIINNKYRNYTWIFLPQHFNFSKLKNIFLNVYE